MTSRSSISALFRLWAGLMVCTLVSCSELLSSEGGSHEGEEQTVTLNIAVTHPDAGIETKAPLDGYDLDFTANEAAVKNLVTFIVSLNPDGTENYDKVDFFEIGIDPADFNKGYYTFSRSLKLKSGSKHIYIGANMNADHINAFLNNGGSLNYTGDGQAIEMVMTPDPTHSGLGTDITMFGQMSDHDTGSRILNVSRQTRSYNVSGELERLTAKVLLTCAEGEPGFVATGGKGWVETSKIRYTLNVINRQTYIKKHWSEEYQISMDPNWNLGDAGHFDSWGEDEILERLFDDRFSTSPLRYDESRLKTNSASVPEGHYVEGLYCLENTTYNNKGLTGANVDKAALQATTHVVIAVRFIPKYVYTGGNVNNGTGPTAMTWETVFKDYLVAGNGHEAGTYWTRTDANGNVSYYGRYAMETYMSKYQVSESEFTCYEGGWSYFTTFIDGKTSDKQLTYANMNAWGVQRDHYYILVIDHITKPGSTVPWNDFIRVNSQTVPWVHRGSQEVIIRPTGN